MPAARPLVLTATSGHAQYVMVVVAGETVSQVALSAAIKVITSAVDLETVNVWFWGFSAPSTAENVRAVGLTVIDGRVVVDVVDWEEGETVRVTGTCDVTDCPPSIVVRVMVAL